LVEKSESLIYGDARRAAPLGVASGAPAGLPRVPPGALGSGRERSQAIAGGAGQGLGHGAGGGGVEAAIERGAMRLPLW
jgi:hypothetical protein